METFKSLKLGKAWYWQDGVPLAWNLASELSLPTRQFFRDRTKEAIFEKRPFPGEPGQPRSYTYRTQLGDLGWFHVHNEGSGGYNDFRVQMDDGTVEILRNPGSGNYMNTNQLFVHHDKLMPIGHGYLHATVRSVVDWMEKNESDFKLVMRVDPKNGHIFYAPEPAEGAPIDDPHLKIVTTVHCKMGQSHE